MTTPRIRKTEIPTKKTSPEAALARHATVTGNLQIALPPANQSFKQDNEWCVVETDEGWQKIRFHDYSDVYSIPGLYEKLFYEVLECNSPVQIRKLIEKTAGTHDIATEELRVLDLGAGNGMVAEELSGLPVAKAVGVDIIPEAAEAVLRDRPGIYEEYLVTDMTNLPDKHREALESYSLNCLTCVAALGFGDIPPKAFAEAYNLLEKGALVAFTIKEDFLTSSDTSGFSGLVHRMIDKGVFQLECQERYRHRLATTGEPLYYLALTGIKNRDVPEGYW